MQSHQFLYTFPNQCLYTKNVICLNLAGIFKKYGFLKNNKLYILEHFGFIAKLSGKYRLPLYVLPKYIKLFSLLTSYTIMVHLLKLLVTHHYHPKSMIYIRFHSWCCAFYDLDECIITYSHHCSTI